MFTNSQEESTKSAGFLVLCLKTQMTSTERIERYGELKQEASPVNNNRPPDGWPEQGCIEFRNVSLYYYEGAPSALTDVTFSIQHKEKIGIVGRTGSGKSSLVHTLFRLTEPEGTIFIDGVDVTEIGLRDLRSKISVIPQVQPVRKC